VFREAIRMARQRQALGYSEPSEEFLSDAYVGLAKACATFDVSRGLKLSTYATPRIRGTIIDALRTESKSRSAHPPIFTDLPVVLVDPRPLPVDAIATEAICVLVRSAVSDPALLTTRERTVVVRRYWHGERQATIARRLRLTEPRISQILAGAHDKLRGALQARLGAA
jgi:RNA polymerase sigma factor (sigma-70 family)